MKKTAFPLFILTVLFSQLIFNSCKQTNIFDYLEERTEKIEVVSAQYSAEFPVDNEGFLCIPSNVPCEILYLVQNPQGKKLEHIITTDTDELVDSLLRISALAPQNNRTSKMEENYSIRLNLPQDYLFQIEKSVKYDGGGPGADFNPLVKLSCEGYSYNGSSVIDPFTEKIRINTPPPPVQGATVIVDSGAATGNTIGCYVLCFNLPDSIFEENGIHSDVEEIFIEGISAQSHGNEYLRGINLNINRTDETYDQPLLPSKKSDTFIANTYNNNNGAGMPAVEFVSGIHPVYIIDTNHYAKRGESRDYKIILKDKKGLTSVTTLNTLSNQLLPVTAATGQTYYEPYVPLTLFSPNDDEDGYVLFNLLAPKGVTGGVNIDIKDAEIYYEVYSLEMEKAKNEEDDEDADYVWPKDSSMRFEEGVAKNIKTLQLYDRFIYKIKAYARKDGFIDSVMRIWNITIGNWRFITIHSITNAGINYGIDFIMDKDDLIVVKNGENYESFDTAIDFSVRFFDLEKYQATGEKIYLNSKEWEKAPLKHLTGLNIKVFDSAVATETSEWISIDNDAMEKKWGVYENGEEKEEVEQLKYKYSSLTYSLPENYFAAAEEGYLFYVEVGATINGVEYHSERHEITLKVKDETVVTP